MWFYFLVLVLLHSDVSQSADVCHRGLRLYTPIQGPDICIKCDQGTFIPGTLEELHPLRKCYPCTKIENSQLEIWISECNRTHDTVIYCIDGYYRTQPSYPDDRGHCQKCTECHFPKHFPKRVCQLYQDAVCCPGDDYGVYINQDGSPECVRECGPGQFLDEVNNQCLPCPQNSYMAVRNHINNYCEDCEGPKSVKEKILQSCNATHSTIIGCVDGYSLSHSNTGQTGDTRCVKLCGRGQFSDLRTDTCLPCPENTYMDEDQHTHIDRCKSCKFPEPLLERVLQTCNSTHPTIIGCVDGYYRRQQPHNLSTSSCVPCRKCSENTDGNIYEGRVCEQSRDSACCSQPEMSVVDALDGPVCILPYTPLTATCGENEYLSTDPSATCLPCPEGTYMDQGNHTNTSCRSCDEFPHEIFCTVEGQSHINKDDGRAQGFMAATIALVLVILLLFIIPCCFKKVRRKLLTWVRRKLHRPAARHKEKDAEATIPLRDGTPSEKPPPRQRTDSEMSEHRRACREFISVSEFKTDHLPFNDDVMVEMIKLQAKLTTLVIVNGSSDGRSQVIAYADHPYPYSDDNYRSTPHTGTGWVERVKMYTNQPCPCATCHQSDISVMSWGELVICTATNVVFDITEGQNCRCHFFYDTTDTDLRSCPSVSNAMTVFSNVERNWCYMTFATHNTRLTETLQDLFADYHRLRREIQHKYKVASYVTSYDEVPGKLSQLRGNLTHNLKLLKDEIAEFKNSFTIYLESPHLDVTTDHNYRQKQDYKVFGDLLDLTAISENYDNKKEKLFTRLSTLKKNYGHSLEEIKVFQQELRQNTVKDLRLAVDKCRELCAQVDELERYLSLILNIRNHSDSSNQEVCPAYKQRYHGNLPLAVIVSHPKGRSQKISLGEVTDRNCLWHDHRCRYRYTNKTCQGCEGARVFILGRTGINDHSHSGEVGHHGESGEWSDIIPYLIDFSVTPENNDVQR